ncbi:Esterase FE4 [Eumeta japonica]|uniref:Carboxylic ester hydrolase n=1 Tax=Eumeta variegata TaxID=151549 RepID=A0A4C1V6E6_EUMVA|nr:Esterase FE4 [Eumeta japonica]
MFTQIDAAARLIEERVLKRTTSQNTLLGQINILALPSQGHISVNYRKDRPEDGDIVDSHKKGEQVCHELHSFTVLRNERVPRPAHSRRAAAGRRRAALDVALAQGPVRGHKHAARALYAFHGIPYATAPTGRDKFKAPLPPPTWEELFDASNNFILCPQNFGGMPYEEQCLIVNVFVPENTSIGIDPPKSVLVIIHGGSFFVGFGNMGLPYDLVEKDIIVVTLNYRLDVHGFLCLNTVNAPGNAALKDQLAALKWVKHNVQAFGGNPDDITVLGYSAGAFTAELLMLSPAADGLFRRVILESGSVKSTWLDPKGRDTAKVIASANGASDVENITRLEDFYLGLSYSELLALQTYDKLLSKFLPCLENEEDDSIITVSPHAILQSGNYSKLPLLTGYTDGEGLIFYDDRERIMAEMNENFSSHLPPNFLSYVAIDEAEAIDMLKSFYFDENTITEDSIRNFTDYFSDSTFIYGIVESARLHALNSASVYLYEFTYEAFEHLQSEPTGLGSTHCTQSFLIHNEGMLAPTTYLNENDLIVQRRLVEMWNNFIKFSEPTRQGDPDYWEPLNPENMNYLVIDLEVRNRSFPIPERLKLWDKIMKGSDTPDNASGLNLNLDIMLRIYIPTQEVNNALMTPPESQCPWAAMTTYNLVARMLFCVNTH